MEGFHIWLQALACPFKKRWLQDVQTVFLPAAVKDSAQICFLYPHTAGGFQVLRSRAATYCSFTKLCPQAVRFGAIQWPDSRATQLLCTSLLVYQLTAAPAVRPIRLLFIPSYHGDPPSSWPRFQTWLISMPPFLVMCSITSQGSHRHDFTGRNPSIINGLTGFQKSGQHALLPHFITPV